MSRVQLLVELPPGMSPLRLREVLEMNEVVVRDLRRVDAADPPARSSQPTAIGLTAAELSVLKAFAFCDTNKEIAAQLGICESTVKSHIKSIFCKLRVHRRARALLRALRLGLITGRDLAPLPKGGEKSAKRGMDKKEHQGYNRT
jgi:DNA-binding NarL/FixJ family response regulator